MFTPSTIPLRQAFDRLTPAAQGRLLPTNKRTIEQRSKNNEVFYFFIRYSNVLMFVIHLPLLKGAWFYTHNSLTHPPSCKENHKTNKTVSFSNSKCFTQAGGFSISNGTPLRTNGHLPALPTGQAGGRQGSFVPNGTPLRTNGITLRPNGHPLRTNGIILRPNGHPLRTNGITLRPNGHLLVPNGITLRLNGHPLVPNGITLRPNGHPLRTNRLSLVTTGTQPRRRCVEPVETGGMLVTPSFRAGKQSAPSLFRRCTTYSCFETLPLLAAQRLH
ncbi:MAG: hypothetical protein HY958_00635 [Bacteroidia bacterium]|nr:hypothetical protein [Bacteroidia bacterium]